MSIKNSPWGSVDNISTLKEGVYFVSTPSHGGFMVHRSVPMSEVAREHAEIFGNYLCFEEDCAAYIVCHELGIRNGTTTTEDIKKMLCFWIPKYVEDSGNGEWFHDYPRKSN